MDALFETVAIPLVNMNEKPVPVPMKLRRRANDAIAKYGNYSDHGVPLNLLIDCCKRNRLIPVMEDGHEWEGFLCGGAECGTEEAKKQAATLPLAMFDDRDGCYHLTNICLCIFWGTMWGTGRKRWEFVAYVG